MDGLRILLNASEKRNFGPSYCLLMQKCQRKAPSIHYYTLTSQGWNTSMSQYVLAEALESHGAIFILLQIHTCMQHHCPPCWVHYFPLSIFCLQYCLCRQENMGGQNTFPLLISEISTMEITNLRGVNITAWSNSVNGNMAVNVFVIFSKKWTHGHETQYEISLFS